MCTCILTITEKTLLNDTNHTFITLKIKGMEMPVRFQVNLKRYNKYKYVNLKYEIWNTLIFRTNGS